MNKGRHEALQYEHEEYESELDYDIWQPSEIQGRDDLNVTIRMTPITERAQSRVQEYGEVMKLMHISHSGPFQCNEEQILVMSLNEKWQGWFRNGIDVEIQLT